MSGGGGNGGGGANAVTSPIVSSILNALDCLPLDDEDAALDAAKSLAIQVKDACTTGDSLT